MLMRNLCLLLFAILCFTSCETYVYDDYREIDAAFIVGPSLDIPIEGISDNITLVRKLNNPYSVSNMRASYLTIKPLMEEAGIEEDDITTTHFYIKFKPDNEGELLSIKEKYADFELYEYPLDYEIIGRISYHDPELPDSVPTYQYASIDSLSWYNIEVPDSVEYEILERLFIPDEDLEIDTYSTRASNNVSYEEAIEALVNESMRRTGNLDDVDSDENEQMGTSSTWYPSGRITAYDDIVDGQIPLEGVKVRARRWFTTRKATTDANGYFQCEKGFKKPANYSIVWEGPGWNIRNGLVVQAYYNGPKKEGSWNLDIPYDEDNKSIRFATIHRAAHRFYCGNVGGLTRVNTAFTENIAYRHRAGQNLGIYYLEWGGDYFSDIRVYGMDGDEYRKVHEILATTFHELGHAAHYTNNIVRFCISKVALIESWASFVGYYLTMMEYNDLGYSSGPFTIKDVWLANHSILLYYEPEFRIDRQMQEITGEQDYTPLIIDLYDIDNQRVVAPHAGYANSVDINKLPNDKIYRIPANTLENFVFSSRKISQIKEKLIQFCNQNSDELNTYYNLSLENINQLFELYENYD